MILRFSENANVVGSKQAEALGAVFQDFFNIYSFMMFYDVL